MAPSPFSPDIVIGKTFRFKAAAAQNARVITWQSFFNSWLVATSSSTTAKLIASVRVRRVEIWAPMASDLVPVEAQLEFVTDSTFGAARRELHSDTSMGSTRPAHLDVLPSPKSLASMWMTESGTASLMTVTCPVNSIVDFHVSIVLRNNEAAATGSVPTGATTGQFYGAPLGGSASGLIPVGINVLPGL